jgi:hypothetical protein
VETLVLASLVRLILVMVVEVMQQQLVP